MTITATNRHTSIATMRRLERGSYAEIWLTMQASSQRAPAEAAAALFAECAERIRETGMLVLQEKIYGALADHDTLLTARTAAWREAGLESDWFPTLLDGRPARSDCIGALQIWGLVPQGGNRLRVSSARAANGRRGRLLEMPDWRALFVSGVTGHRPDGALAATVTAQAEQMFANVESALHASHMNWQNVARTWIYLDRLLDWYGEFNRVRSSFFASRGVTADRPGHAFPASTGVGCRMGGAECCMDVLAVAAELDSSVQLRPLQRSVRQEPPARYGSAFSRGMSLRVEGRQTIFVSGTASIGPDGRTRHTDSVEAQINETMLNLAALPQTVGAGLSDITSATLFCKEAATLPLFESMVELLGVPRFPYVPVVADICRPDLAFEIEAVAVAS